ncbi:MAG: acetate--CoA ligase family protein [Planctomycetes bacterium]|nr:acetate--CoA ligase family protein [Planctomycetota bacterium]
MHRSLTELVRAARAEGRATLLETEAMTIAAELGIDVPRHVVVAGAERVARTERLPGDRVVVKVIAADVLHKTEFGGVAVVANEPAQIAAAVHAMGERLIGHDVRGFLIAEFVDHDARLGGELLLGLRFTEDFGPVVTLGAGGTDAEFLARSLRSGEDVAILSAEVAAAREVGAALHRAAIARLVTEPQRGQPPRLATERLVAVLQRALALGAEAMPQDLAELEFNPLALTADGRLVALDALAKLGTQRPAAPAPRPVDKLPKLLEPSSIAVVGVSRRMNPGHVILGNVLREGFPRERVFVVKPDETELDGCACVPAVEALPEKVDLLVVAVEAAQVPEVVATAIRHDRAETMILIPGGLGESSGSAPRVAAMHTALAEARATADRGPLLNGGNCLGIRSRPGRYDTLFIPEHKLGFAEGRPAPLALLSQSGAFAVARSSTLGAFAPKYVVTAGNQVDLTIGDYLTHLADDPELTTFACYVEGFRPLDGARFLAAARRIAASGRSVVLYRAGRSPAGASAASSHTASIAGDYAVTRALCAAAGVLVAETLGEFDDLTRLSLLLTERPLHGLRLGAVSNAGFECVAIADHLGALELAPFGDSTRTRLGEVLEAARIAGFVDVRNPLDLTPIASDAAYEAALRAVLAEPDVDLAVVGIVPMTPALQTLAGGPTREDVAGAEAVGPRLLRAAADARKPVVAVVDGGPRYDALARLLERGGLPTFRRADRALRALTRYAGWRLARTSR